MEREYNGPHKGLSNEQVYNKYMECGGNARLTGRTLGVHHECVRSHVERYRRMQALAGNTAIPACTSGINRPTVDFKAAQPFEVDDASFHTVGGKRCKRFVITSATNDTATNTKFFGSLKNYCDKNGSKLVVIPIRYKNPTSQVEDAKVITWDSSLPIVEKNFRVAESLWVMASIKIPATAENPLSGFDGMSKGNSLVIGHPQLQKVNLPVLHGNHPIAMWTTGSVSNSVYSDTKVGTKAGFNHSLAAIVVEVEDDESFHIRDLCFDGEGFYDIDHYYSEKGVVKVKGHVSALVTGDTHVEFVDPDVVAATYTNDDSICNVLKPKEIVVHDPLDCYSISHHHKKNTFTKLAKFKAKKNSIKDELDRLIEFYKEITPKFSSLTFVDSNHPGHLSQWLMEHDPREDMENLEFYHMMMYQVLREVRMTQHGTSAPDPFRMYVEPELKATGISCNFLGSGDSHIVCGVELSMHGHNGANGSRGSLKQFSKLPVKNVSGHGHASGIDKWARKVGTSTYKRLEYNKGASTWDHAHCAIYANGQMQNISIINGRWRGA